MCSSDLLQLRIGEGGAGDVGQDDEVVPVQLFAHGQAAGAAHVDVDAFGFESIQQYSRGDNRWPGDIAAWREARGSHISVVTMGANLTTVDGHIEAIRRWRDVYNSVA